MTDKELGLILDDIVVVVDTREQKNQHIIEYLKANKIPYIEEKMESADYTFILPSYGHLGLDRKVLVERKNSLDEIIGNFTKNRDRFIREFERMDDDTIRHIVIETATWTKLLKGSYRSNVPQKALMASIMTWNVRYNCSFWYANTNESPVIIYNLLYYGLRERLRDL